MRATTYGFGLRSPQHQKKQKKNVPDACIPLTRYAVNYAVYYAKASHPPTYHIFSHPPANTSSHKNLALSRARLFLWGCPSWTRTILAILALPAITPRPVLALYRIPTVDRVLGPRTFPPSIRCQTLYFDSFRVGARSGRQPFALPRPRPGAAALQAARVRQLRHRCCPFLAHL